MAGAPEKTEEIDLAELAPPGGAPARPGVPPPPTPSRAHPEPVEAPRGQIRRPYRRLLKAYLVTTQLVLSYFWVSVQRRFRSEDAHARLVADAHRRNARRALRAIIELQGLFIKVGQLISIMANFLPEAFRSGLKGLQDQVPPRPYADIEARLREEFGGRGPREVFAAFDERPIASASIGQVHVARLSTGEQVAVKVQYPDIEQIVRTDLRALKRIFGVLGRLMPDWGFDTIYRDVREMLLAELDYRQEAEAMRVVSANFENKPDVLLPRVMTAYSTARVLTTEWMAGTKLEDTAGLEAAGIDRRRAARLVVEAYCQQIFIDGVYHADPHPGNLLLRPGATPGAGPSIVFLDFGATARVPDNMRKGMITFLQGAMTRDSARIVAGMKEMGFISRRANPEVFDRVVEYFHDKLRSQMRMDGFSLKDIRFEPEAKLASLLDLRDLNVSVADLRDAFHVPKDWILLERTLLLLLGVCTTLDPEMNPAGAIQPYVEKFLLGEKKEWSDAVLDAAREASLSALALPAELGRFLTQAGRGDLEVRLRGLDESVRAVYAVGQQLVWGGLGTAAAGFAVVFDGRGQEDARFWAIAAGCTCGLFFLLALLRGRRQIHRR